MNNISEIVYDNASFQMVCQRKNTRKEITYFLYVIDNSLILTQELNSQQPKYVLEINLQLKVYWNQERQKITQFGFESKDEVKYFDGNCEDFKQLKRLLRNRVMYRDVSDFYLPIKQLGRGGSSRVYLVMDKCEKYEFASKNVEKRYLREDGGFEALFNEINLMAALDHENIVKMEEVYEGETTFYLILEYLKGNSLHDLISKGIIQLDWDEIRSIMFAILTAVAHMHSLNIMHRDLKPENIMFKKLNDIHGVRIVDFGLATWQTAATYPFPKCGTPGYVAPEIANLKDLTFKYDKICDMFSVGCIFYKLITSKDLFPGNDYHEILKLNKKCIINLDTLSLYSTPQSAIDLISQMLQAVPHQRISAQQALDHPFFTGTFIDRKMKFQSSKKQLNNNSKPWQTSTFKTEKSDRLQLPEIKQRSRQKDDDNVDEETPKMRVPTLNSPRLAQHAKKKNLALNDNSPTEFPKKSAFKKFSTQDFDPLTPDTQSPDSGRMNFSNSPRLIQQSVIKRKFTYSKFNQQRQQAIYEVDDEQKH
ncbi:unnamed protein product (macronuclear) [Paramecium tetraurelia]|uniref:Protein kinase domain-containing protein n=1 Tax=Paramecium tetraurelia TaxID=5888 RepID=A0DQW6_PARTE|nr:uncharacterized protein GSPATT00002833001 [Paramecium tetraurelia]CAK85433.1 unnamed protein product [Paramecium tetraurelia]|eukprot:XP_001452830.1 hypothetical protein (macronuclear) [Paramecium tetraurelia strain d4-2]